MKAFQSSLLNMHRAFDNRGAAYKASEATSEHTWTRPKSSAGWSPRYYAQKATFFATSPQTTSALDSVFGRGNASLRAGETRPANPPSQKGIASPTPHVLEEKTPQKPFLPCLRLPFVALRKNLLGAVGLGVKFLVLGLSHIWAQISCGRGFLSLSTYLRQDVENYAEVEIRDHLQQVEAHAAQASDEVESQFVKDVVDGRMTPFLSYAVPESKEALIALRKTRKAAPEKTLTSLTDPLGSDTLAKDAVALVSQSVVGCLLTAIRRAAVSHQAEMPSEIASHRRTSLVRIFPPTQTSRAFVRVDMIVSHAVTTDPTAMGDIDAYRKLKTPLHIEAQIPLGTRGKGTRVCFKSPSAGLLNIFDRLDL